MVQVCKVQRTQTRAAATEAGKFSVTEQRLDKTYRRPDKKKLKQIYSTTSTNIYSINSKHFLFVVGLLPPPP